MNKQMIREIREYINADAINKDWICKPKLHLTLMTSTPMEKCKMINPARLLSPVTVEAAAIGANYTLSAGPGAPSPPGGCVPSRGRLGARAASGGAAAPAAPRRAAGESGSVGAARRPAVGSVAHAVDADVGHGQHAGSHGQPQTAKQGHQSVAAFLLSTPTTATCRSAAKRVAASQT